MRTNVPNVNTAKTEGGAPAFGHLKPIQQLRRSVLACLLFEGEFYESGKSIAERITETANAVSVEELAALAVEARTQFHLRHVPLLLLTSLAKRGGSLVGKAIAETIQRPDELAEFLALYWKKGKSPLSAQVKKGLGQAFNKFNAYSLAKYNRDDAIKLRDVLFLCHAKPKDTNQALVFKQLVDGKLPTPDTWETELSAGKDKKETFERLIKENKLGYFALLRNLRNMEQAGVDTKLVCDAIVARKNGADKILPFRFIAAARHAPRYEPALDESLLATIKGLPKFGGRTVVLVDVSGSMATAISAKSDLTRMDAACALASIVPSDDLRVFSFSDRLVEVPPRKGMSGVDAIRKSQHHSSTQMAEAIAEVNKRVPYDRIIVITDEQSTSYKRVPDPVKGTKAYMINVASYRNGVGYGAWTHLDGFSENVLRYIYEIEKETAQ